MNEKCMLVKKELKIQAYDIDVVGIVSNIVYVRWFEELRSELMEPVWPYEQMLRTGRSPILVRTEADYKAPLKITDKPVGEAWLVALTRARWTVGIEIKADGRPVCLGRQTGCFYDMKAGRPVGIPAALRDIYGRLGAQAR